MITFLCLPYLHSTKQTTPKQNRECTEPCHFLGSEKGKGKTLPAALSLGSPGGTHVAPSQQASWFDPPRASPFPVPAAFLLPQKPESDAGIFAGAAASHQLAALQHGPETLRMLVDEEDGGDEEWEDEDYRDEEDEEEELERMRGLFGAE